MLQFISNECMVSAAKSCGELYLSQPKRANANPILLKDEYRVNHVNPFLEGYRVAGAVHDIMATVQFDIQFPHHHNARFLSTSKERWHEGTSRTRKSSMSS